MSLADDLDQWATELGQAVGVDATRDPDLIHPPCLFVDLPRSASGTLTSLLLEVPVHLVAWGTGKQAGDQLLDTLPALVDATGVAVAEKVPLTVGDITYPTFQVLPIVQVTPDTVTGPPVFTRGTYAYSSATTAPPPVGMFGTDRHPVLTGETVVLHVSTTDHAGVAHNLAVAPGSDLTATDTVSGGSFTGTITAVHLHPQHAAWHVTVTAENGTVNPGDLVSLTVFAPTVTTTPTP